MSAGNSRLAGKVAIVTGAGTAGEGMGTGRATSIAMAREGADVLLVDLLPDRAEATRTMIEGESGGSGGSGSGRAEVFVGDLTEPGACQAAVEAAVSRFGRLDILVNNLGGGFRKPAPDGAADPGTATATGVFGNIVDMEPEEWDRVVNGNLRTQMLMSKFAIPAMAATGGGSIIGLSSISSQRASLTSGAYAAAKAGVEGLTRYMAVVHGRQGIRFNVISPGHIFTAQVNGIRGRFDDDKAKNLRDKLRMLTPLGTEGTAWDIAWLAVFLASDEARWISGVTIPVDGGTLATMPLSTWLYDAGLG